MYVHRRANWEFFVVLKGRCATLPAKGNRPQFRTRHLWAYPPETAHGWAGVKSSPCEVAILHYSSVPNLLERLANENGHLEADLTPAQIRRIGRLVAELKPHYERITEKSALVFERALLELTLMALENIPSSRAETKKDFAVRKVETATIWYQDHMTDRPKIDEIARAVHLSARHLRRLFHEVKGVSPQVAFTRLRIERAMKLMSETQLKLETIAARCGFASASDFHRVFKQYRRINPDTWRRNRIYARSKQDDARMLRS